ncbi:MAG: hypothetical protein ING75_13690 [Rhodocyclaceae bacterium]|nr:hypothetical protein [Rhodocyclaceae bacterium]
MINFKNTLDTAALGRNGWLQMSGMDVRLTNNVVEIIDGKPVHARRQGVVFIPRDSRGSLARCEITIPIEAIDDTIAALQAVKARANLQQPAR